jgi:hypothetical protein
VPQVFGTSWGWLFDNPRDKAYSVCSAEELKAACKRVGVTKIKEYVAVYREHGWPSAPTSVFDKPWSWYFDSVWKANKTFAVSTAQELKEACKAQGVSTIAQYKRVYKQFDWPSAPNLTFGKPFSWLFDSVKVYAVSSAGELRAACEKAGVRSQSQYRRVYRDYNWPSSPDKLFELKWSELFGSTSNANKTYSVDSAEELKRACAEHGVTSSVLYKRLYKQFNWPSLPDKAFGVPWTYFFDSVRSADKTYSVQTAKELKAACTKLKIGSQKQYKAVYRQHAWPANPHRTFHQPWSWFFDSESSADKQFSVRTAEELKAVCEKLGISTFQQYKGIYRKYDLPAHPDRTFGLPWSWFMAATTAERERHERSDKEAMLQRVCQKLTALEIGPRTGWQGPLADLLGIPVGQIKKWLERELPEVYGVVYPNGCREAVPVQDRTGLCAMLLARPQAS